MSDKINKFIKAFLALSPEEKKRVAEIATAISQAPGPINESRIIKSFGLESLGSSTTVNFAPVPGSCPTCGK